MSITEESTPRPAAPAPVSTVPSPGSPESTGFTGRRIAALVGLAITVLGAASVLLVNIGAPEDNEAAESPNVQSSVEFDPGPPWEPNRSALDQLGYGNPTTDPETEFAGIPAPQWHPNYGRLETYLGAEPVTGIR